MDSVHGTEITVALLMACHNRRDRTLAALAALHAQEQRIPSTVHVYLLDDDSSDGTVLAVQEQFPQTRILHGDGSLYWNGGMRRAFQEAKKNDPDYYLWLNDDTTLYPTALDTLLSTAKWATEQGDKLFVVVGSVQDAISGQHTYGGMMHDSWWHRLKFRPVHPSGIPLQCHTMNGNCVLVSRSVARVVGNLSKAFTHAFGDLDYGLRVRYLGANLWVAPGYLGVCPRNSHEGTWLDSNLPFRKRLRMMTGPKGVPPGEFWIFARRHGGSFWPLFWLLPYRRILNGALRMFRRSRIRSSRR